MTFDIKHDFVATAPAGPDPDQVQSSHWNDGHVLTGNLPDTRVELDGAISPYADGDTVHSVLSGIVSSIASLTSAVAGKLSAAFTQVRKNSTGTSFARNRLNFIEGTNVTITVADDAANDEVDITIAASGGGGGGGFETDGVNAVKFEAGRHWLYGPDGSGADSYIYLGTAGLDITSWSGLYLTASGEPVWFSADQGIVMPYDSAVPTGGIADTGHVYVDDRDPMHFLQMGQPGMAASPDQWYHQGLPSSGWLPQAFPMGFVQDGVYTTARSLAASHDTLAVPFLLPAPMDLASVDFWNTDTTGVREWEVALWHQPFQGNATNDKLLAKVAGSQNFGGGGSVFGAGKRGTSYGAGDCIVPAGLVWVTIKNTHASNTLGIGYLAGSAQMALNLAQQKVLSSTAFDGDTLDFIAATWTKLTDIHAVALRGRVFGQTTAF